MNSDLAVMMARHLLMEALILCAPILIAACVVSLGISLLQTLTGVQEQTLVAVPRLAAVVAVALVTLPWTVHRLTAFTLALWVDLRRYAG